MGLVTFVTPLVKLVRLPTMRLAVVCILVATLAAKVAPGSVGNCTRPSEAPPVDGRAADGVAVGIECACAQGW